jgi:large repetitive protein
MNTPNPSQKPAAVPRAGGYMKHLNHITFGFVFTLVLAGCLAAAAQDVGVFTPTGSLNTARSSHTATLLDNGKVLVAGGETFDPYDGALIVASAELYDPATGVWTPTGSMKAARAGHTATLLANGKVLVAGGYKYDVNGNVVTLASTELYDPATGTWTPTGNLKAARSGHTATLLPNGKTLVAGGEEEIEVVIEGFPEGEGISLTSAELYDPATGAWTPTGSLTGTRSHHTATLLPNGKVLVAGGVEEVEEVLYSDLPYEDSTLASAELYDPATGVWSPTGGLANPRSSHTATLLANGQVLVAGGNAGGYTLASTELYDPATGVWSPTGSLNTPRSGHTVTLLANGQVLVAGGNAGDSSAELYDPATGAWYPTGTTISAGTATLLPSGQVLIAGGEDEDGYGSAGAELYEPGVSSAAQGPDAFIPTGSLTLARYGHTATLLPNGQVFVAGGVFGYTAELYNPATGGWDPTGGNFDPSYHTATLLPNGKVLVAGGNAGDDTPLGGYAVYANLNSTELYDPATGVWTPTGNLNTARYSHTATLLPNGKVLVAGGCYYELISDQLGTTVPLASAELYDPATGVWAPTGSMGTARYYHTATLLPNGQVLVAGGAYPNNSAELYDPATGVWTPTGSLNTARYEYTATLLPNGQVLVAGGNGTNGVLASAELYDPATGVWTVTGSLANPRYSHTATLLPNGQVLVVGGYGSGGYGTAELYNPATGGWSLAGYLYTPRGDHTATLLADGQVLVAGGGNVPNGGSGGSYFSSAELYVPAIASLSPLPSPVKLGDGSIQLGFSYASGPSYSVLASPSLAAPLNTWSNLGLATETTLGSGQFQFTDHQAPNYPQRFYRMSMATTVQNTNDFLPTGSLATARAYHTSTLLANGKVLVAGGYAVYAVLNSTELYDPATGVWTRGGSLANPRYYHTATLLASGKVLVAGGVGTNGTVLTSAELYDPATGVWTPTGSLNTGRAANTATLLANGTVLVAGGGNNYRDPINSAEVYDPATGVWTPTGNLNAVRYEHTATLLPNGQVLVAGGDGILNGVSLASAELYDPATGVWTPTGSLGSARDSHSATLLSNGQVLVAGGDDIFNGVSLASAELYDPATGAWTSTGSLSIQRSFHTASLLSSGKVLVAGGISYGGYPSCAEVYDPVTGAWTLAGNLATARADHTATLLSNGQVLITGGVESDLDSGGNNIPLASSELYDPSR